MIPIDFGHVLIVLKSHRRFPSRRPLMTSFLDFRVADGRSWRRRIHLTNLERFDYSTFIFDRKDRSNLFTSSEAVLIPYSS